MNPADQIPPVTKIVMFLFGSLSTPTEALFRFRTGVRYISPPQILVSFATMIGFAFVLGGMANYGGQARLMVAVAAALCGWAFYRYAEARRDEIAYENGVTTEVRHTYFAGESYFVIYSYGVTQRFLEPAIAILAGAALSVVTPVGAILWLGGIGMFFKTNAIAHAMLTRRRDIRDAKFMSEVINEEMAPPSRQPATRTVAQ